MNIYVIGVNHYITPLHIRERLSISDKEYYIVLDKIRNYSNVMECSVLSTCNRTEFHLYSEVELKETDELEKIWCEVVGVDINTVKSYFYFYQSEKAVKHIFKVASGMDSLIVGEDQVLGQFKRAYEKAMKIKMTGPILNTLSRYAITASKKMKTQIYESKKHNSISKLVVKQLYKCYKEDVHNKSALVIGNGYIGTLILKELSNFGLASLYVTTRNYGYKEENLINNTGVNIIDYEDRYSVIDKCEIIISATSSPHYTITYNLLNKFIDINKEYVFIDLAVPRDFDNTISNINNIRYYNIDSFTLHINELLEDESIDVIYIENVLDKWVKDYCNWFSYKDIVPIIQDTRDYAYEVILNRLDKVINSISYLNDKDRKMIKYSTENIYKIVLNRVLYSIKNYDVTDNMEDYFNKLKKSISNIR